MRNIGKIFFVLGIHQLCVSWMQGNFPPSKAVWDKLFDTYMDIYDHDTVGSMLFKDTQFEYHEIDDNYYPLTFDMLDSKHFSEAMEFLNAHYTI